MLHREFIKKWTGKSYAETPQLWVQCVWSVKNYCKEMWFSISSFWWSAWNWWKTWCPFDSKWKRVEYKPWLYPSQWDIVFWSESRCKDGHVSIANKFCNKDVLRHFDGNGTGNWDPYTNRFTDYKNVVGWMTKK